MRSIQFYFLLAAMDFVIPLANAADLTEQGLIGRWQCQSLMHGSMPDKTGTFVEGWQKDSQGLAVTLDNAELNFNRGNESYTLTSSSPNPFLYFSSEAVNSPYRVVGDQLVFTYYADGTNFLWEIRSIAEDKMRLVPLGNGYYPTVTCDKVMPASTVAAPTTTDTSKANGRK